VRDLTDRAATGVRQLTSAPAALFRSGPQPEALSFSTGAGRQVHGLLHVGPGDECARPLIVRPHPGPTANAQLRADPWIAFFTGHGFAVLEIDYSGSTGYGRRFRNSLRGQWGELDASDCAEAVLGLADRRHIDPTRIGIHGSSAGGYTARRALALTDLFAAAAVRHAVIDPDEWRRTAPKFQAHHVDLLIAPPSRAETLRRRSVVGDVDAVTAPVLIVHGERDPVTPISQARRLADLMGDKASLLTFADEGHSVRRPENQRRALDAELAHFRRALHV
jgi:dipeptidyl aminopeptidase/acylaminoacyl peptidase